MNHYKRYGLTYEELTGGSGDLEKDVRYEFLENFKNNINPNILPSAKFTKSDLGQWLTDNVDKNLFVYLGVMVDTDDTKVKELMLIFEFIEISATGDLNLSTNKLIGYYQNESLLSLTKKDAKKYYTNFKNHYEPKEDKLQGFVWGYEALKNVHEKLGKEEEEITLCVGYFRGKFVFYGIPSKGNYQYIAYRNEAVEPTVLGIPPMEP